MRGEANKCKTEYIEFNIWNWYYLYDFLTWCPPPNTFCPQNPERSFWLFCIKQNTIAVKIWSNNNKKFQCLASLLRPHVSLMFDKRVSGWGQHWTLVGSLIALDWKGSGRESHRDALPFPPHRAPGPGDKSLCARHPWSSLDRLWASHRWPFFELTFFVHAYNFCLQWRQNSFVYSVTGSLHLPFFASVSMIASSTRMALEDVMDALTGMEWRSFLIWIFFFLTKFL